MNHKICWLLYDGQDLAVNRDYAALMQKTGLGYGLQVETVTLQALTLGMNASGQPTLLRNGEASRPEAVLSRMRYDWVSEHMERMGIPVFNNSKVCRICNDKRRTHLFLQGLPMAETVFQDGFFTMQDDPVRYPRIFKPADGHGGESVQLLENNTAYDEALRRLNANGKRPALHQAVIDQPGRDLRVYVLFGKILAGVLRTAKAGVVSNFKLGGSVALHELTDAERLLAEAVIQRFEDAGAPLCMAGVDLLYSNDGPVVSEVEDVVGSRMLYQVSDIDLVDLYLQGIAQRI